MTLIHRLMVRFLRYRHPWRVVGFDEVAELYISNLMRMIALTMVMTLSMVYLYKLGYSLAVIAAYFGGYGLLRVACAWPAAQVVARVGPKHATLISNILWVPALIGLSMVESAGWWALGTFAVLQAACITIFNIAYHVNFSKVKHDDHAGKELATMRALSQIGRAVSPVIGGLVAFAFGAPATILLAAAIFLVAAMPLLVTPEPVATRQRIRFRGLPWRRIWRGAVANMALGADFVASTATWGLFVALAVFGVGSDAVYAQLGFVSSVTLLAGAFTAKAFGQLIDRRRGDELLEYSVAGNMLAYAIRPFVATPLAVVLINVLNEAVTSGYVMTFLRGQYAMADELPGYRIAYMAVMEAGLAAGGVICFVAIALASVAGLGDLHSLMVGFLVGMLGGPLLLGRRFPGLL